MFPVSRLLRPPAPFRGAAAGVDRRLAEAEFRSYIRASRYYLYGNTCICNKQV